MSYTRTFITNNQRIFYIDDKVEKTVIQVQQKKQKKIQCTRPTDSKAKLKESKSKYVNAKTKNRF